MPRSNFVRAREMVKKIGHMYFGKPIVPRHPILRAIEGVYKVTDYYGDDELMATYAMGQFPDLVIRKHLPNGRRLSQYLMQLKYWAEPAVAKFIENIQEKDYHITCRASDIARMSMSKHYSSCRKLDGGAENDDIKGFLESDSVAIIVVKDRGGEFLGRQILRYHEKWKKGYGHKSIDNVITIHKAYGNIAHRASLAAVTMALSLNPNLKVTVEDRHDHDG